MARRGRARLDAELVRRGLAATRTEAQRLVADGRVRVRGSLAGKPAAQVAPDEPVAVVAPAERTWASRGGHKLEGALDALGIDPAGRRCLDAGASHGGFTDVLLVRGAAHVTCVDVGYGQLAWHLRTDGRTSVLDRTNVRHLTPADLTGPPPTLVVADLSFISLTLVVGALAGVADPAGEHLLMVKPQFEAGRGRVGKGGVVRDPEVWRAAVERVSDAGQVAGLIPVGVCCSPLPGPSGNIELFWHAVGPANPRAGGPGDMDAAIEAAIDVGRGLADPGTAEADG